ncbi:hypothetical protein [Moorena producens]|uniref:hypothetical protein n=1 Tax=Moorena producens TaxID=1155739 RepID=UPI0011EA638E|nr:hypothetical protein [Moorena producens]
MQSLMGETPCSLAASLSYPPHPTPYTLHPTPDVKVKNIPLKGWGDGEMGRLGEEKVVPLTAT